jgi:hypothetical protein
MRSQMRSSVLSIFVVASAFVALGCGGGGAANVTAGPMPEGGTFTGEYYSPQYGEMHMIQNGSAVVGEYKHEQRSGKIQGEAEGDVLRFEWVERKAMVSNRPQESRGRGYFRYMIDSGSGDHVIKGEWGPGDQETGGGPWNAYRMKNKEPRLSGDDTSGGEGEGDSLDDSSDGSSESSDDDLF